MALQPPLVAGAQLPRQAREGISVDSLVLVPLSAFPSAPVEGQMVVLASTRKAYKFTDGVWEEVGISSGANRHTTLVVISPAPAATSLPTNVSTVYTTFSGDPGFLGSTVGVFNDDEGIGVQLNGVWLLKGSDVIYDTDSSFSLPTMPLDVGDVLHILTRAG